MSHKGGENMHPAKVQALFDRVCRGSEERARAIFLTNCTAGFWMTEVQTRPSGLWHTLEFRVVVIDPATIQVDERRSHTFRDYTKVEAYIRYLRRDDGGEPKPLGTLNLTRLDPRTGKMKNRPGRPPRNRTKKLPERKVKA